MSKMTGEQRNDHMLSWKQWKKGWAVNRKYFDGLPLFREKYERKKQVQYR